MHKKSNGTVEMFSFQEFDKLWMRHKRYPIMNSSICSLSLTWMHTCMHTCTLTLKTHHGKCTLDIYNCCQVIWWIFGAYLTSKGKPWFSNVFIMLTGYLIVLRFKVSSSVAGSIGKGHTNWSSWWTSVVWISILGNLRTQTDLKCDILIANPICLSNPHPEKRKNTFTMGVKYKLYNKWQSFLFLSRTVQVHRCTKICPFMQAWK